MKRVNNTQEQRLHPLSWLLGLLGFLPQVLMMAVIAPLSMAGGNPNDLAPWLIVLFFALGLLLAVLVPLLQYLTYHYRIEQDRLIVRSGILARTRREIPFTRIHNVALHQNLWHRLFNVAELRLESAAGSEPEAHMRVLALDQALVLERLIRGSTVVSPKTAAAHAPTSTKNNVTASNTLLILPLAEQIRLGLLSNQAWIGLIALFGIVQQFTPEKIISEKGASWAKQADVFFAGNVTLLTGLAIGLLLLTWVMMQVVSVILTIVQYHGFKLTEIDNRLTVERGLFTRRRSSVARRRIQSWTLYEGILQRLLGRRRLQVDIASVAQPHLQGQVSAEAERDLVPLASISVTNHLLQHLLPKLQWPVPYWQNVALGQWWRLCLPTLLPSLTIISALACWQWGAQGMGVWLWLGWSVFKARRHIRRMGWALDGSYLIIRHGWWRRTWRLIELEKLQGLQLKRSPLDRWLNTATLYLDSAGAVGSPPLQLRLLPYARACRLFDHLTQETAQRKLQW